MVEKFLRLALSKAAEIDHPVTCQGTPGKVQERTKDAGLPVALGGEAKRQLDHMFLHEAQGIRGLGGVVGQTPLFPRIFGYKAVGIVESVGEGITDLVPSDHVLPVFIGECNECGHCKSDESNMCDLLRINTDREEMLRLPAEVLEKRTADLPLPWHLNF